LYLYTYFFPDVAVVRLFGAGVTTDQLNDDVPGRTLDAIAGYGPSGLLNRIVADCLLATDYGTHCVRVGTTTASVHDSRIDLSRQGETVYRDKGYFGMKPRASMDRTMHRATRGRPLSVRENRRNTAISRTRSLVE